MADLSSCYFCGAAMDVSLREYPVVPEAFDPTPDDQETVLLCGTCQRKLSRVVEPVVDAARAQHDRQQHATTTGHAVDSSSPITDADAHARPDDDQRSTAGTDDETTVNTQIISPTVGSDDEPTDESPRADADPDHATDDDTTPFDVDDTTSVFDDDDDDTDGSNSPGTSESVDSPDSTDPTESIFADGTTTIQPTDDQGTDTERGDTERTEEANHPPSNQTQSRNATDRSGDTLGNGINFSDDTPDTTTGSSTNSPTTNTQPSPSTSSDSTSTTSDASNVDAKTYNKVVRLLKNRDLPIPRDEIETIASSAYDIPAHECEAIIDATVKRGLVAERNGNLVHPDGV